MIMKPKNIKDKEKVQKLPEGKSRSDQCKQGGSRQTSKSRTGAWAPGSRRETRAQEVLLAKNSKALAWREEAAPFPEARATAAEDSCVPQRGRQGQRPHQSSRDLATQKGDTLGDAESSGALRSRAGELATAQGVIPRGHPRLLPRPPRAPQPHRTPSPLPGMAFETFLLCPSRNL